MTSNEIEFQKHLETQRHNREVESKDWFNATTDRAYKEGQVAIGHRQAGASEQMAAASANNAAANWYNAYENMRHNTATEVEQNRHNTQQEHIQDNANVMKYITDYGRLTLQQQENIREWFKVGLSTVQDAAAIIGGM